MLLRPVILVLGRAKLATNPEPTGSPTDTMTMGTVEVARWRASTDGVAHATMASRLAFAKSSARAEISSVLPRSPLPRTEALRNFDERRGYVGSHPELRSPGVALSLGGLRRRIEALMLPDDPHVVLQLDIRARRERDRRRQQAQLSERRRLRICRRWIS
jgi:hypothetical protein